ATVMSAMLPDAACLGWGDSSMGEDQFVSRSSSNGVFTVPANFAFNLSTLSSVRDPFITQRTYTPPPAETNVHYVTFIATDGDNVQWDVGGFSDYFRHPARGSFNMGWTIAPSLTDLAPSVLRWFYDNSSNGPNRDFFVAGASGSGYMYPSMYPASELATHVQKLNNFMARGDLNIGEILDFNSVSRIDLWNQYLAQPTMDALYYLEYSPYHGANGAIYFSTNGKPVIACRESLWGGLEEESTVISHINSASRDSSSPLGYTMVAVHVWTKNLDNVRQVVTNLASDVRVVTPDVFAKLVQQNVGRRLTFDFANGLQGWTTNKGTKQFDNAQWTGSEGGGALLLDGSDLGTPDTTRNAWSTRAIFLPPNAATLSFDTRATGDGRLRVRAKDASVSNPPLVVLSDWDTPTTTNWVTRAINVSGYAGQTVTLYFEQTDGGPNASNARYVDNVAILTVGPALYVPAPPRLFAAVVSTNTGVNLAWRKNDNLADQFKIERRFENGTWSVIATVAGTATNVVDVPAIWGTNYQYRLRGQNNSGFSAYSNERDVTASPKRPAFDTPPFSRTNNAGTAATFSVITSGSTPMNYQWQKNGLSLTNGGNISGATTATLTLAAVFGADAGAYRVAATNSVGSSNSASAMLTVIDPVITSQPSSRTNNADTVATFSVAATGTAALNFRWRKDGLDLNDGENISGTTATVLTLAHVSPDDLGNYSVQITNNFEAVTSAIATLTVIIDPPVITVQPSDRTNDVGTSAAFSVTATGTAPMYQWKKNNVVLLDGGNISGATGTTLTLLNVSQNDEGNYSVVLTNATGTDTSLPAALTIVLPVVSGPPVLIIAGQESSVALSWPDAATNFALYFSTNLFSPWFPVTNSPLNQNGSNTLVLPMDQSNRFFRLIGQ
ncbi:MAG: immunoglobulin domain-containing protein, partial [Verrucomicrobiota bacterium]